VLSLATSDGPLSDDGRREPTLWTIHGERVIDDTRKLRLSIAQVELPDGVHFEQYVLRMPKAAITVLLDDARGPAGQCSSSIRTAGSARNGASWCDRSMR
jgi:hypothetical protein